MEGLTLAIIEKKDKKKEIDEAMVDRIVEETKKQKNLKEQIYDKINVPVWALDVLIVVLVAALLLVIVFGRCGARRGRPFFRAKRRRESEG